MGPSFGNGADGAYLCFCFVQRREIMEVNVLVSRSFVLLGVVFFVGRFGFGYRLGQARTRSTVLCCVVVLKQPRRRRCNSEDDVILIGIYLFEYQLICSSISSSRVFDS